MQVKFLYANSIIALNKLNDDYLISLEHELIDFTVIDSHNTDYKYIEFFVIDDEDGADDIEDDIETDDEPLQFVPSNSWNKIKILHANTLSALENLINVYLSDIKTIVGAFPLTEIVRDIHVKSSDAGEFKYIAWIIHDTIVMDACTL